MTASPASASVPLPGPGNLARLDATVIVCTYNRAESLRDTLQALRAQRTHPSRRWEVVVVDNNSGDHTHQVVDDARREWPVLRYVFEPAQGLSHARNHGIAVARGDVLLFTDDDVLPEADWLESTLSGLETYQADACGGYIAPIWEAPPPPWLTERFYGFLAIRIDRSDDYPITQSGQAPYGANMAIRKPVFDCVGLFDTNRGRKGKVLASGEDGEMFERILGAGLKAVFLGQSRVHHKVEAFRLTKRYLRLWRLQNSRNLAISRGIAGGRRIFNVPLYLFPQLLRAVARATAARIIGPRDEAFHREIIVCHFLGTVQGLWHQWRDPSYKAVDSEIHLRI
jgi:glucosyl-dolichyl phosphate glucuronosyltransferase